jgi:thiamine-phosphate pyrophosphorylase
MHGLYAIADVGALSARGVDVLPFARAVLAARPAALQLRAKDVGAREMLSLLRALLPMCRHAHVPLVANDRADVAALAGCDIVHIGQHDLPIDIVRRLAPQLGVGVSTHDPEQLARALADRPTYVAYGPVFPTASKENPDPVVGLPALRAAHAAAARAQIPLVAIGGITLERAIDVADAADAGAVIGALLPPTGAVEMDEVTARARALHAALLRARDDVRGEARG